MRPVVGYQGGKRRLLPRLRPHFPVPGVTHYIEPFVGMGANYLDLRSRGYDGPAVLADSNQQVADFWRMVHDDRGPHLCAAAAALGEVPATTARYYSLLDERVGDRVELAARWLWLTNYAFGNAPAVYGAGGWSRTGTKLTSAEKWGKTFPWGKCVDRLGAVVDLLREAPVVVVDDAAVAVAFSTSASHVYADPPYAGQYTYAGTSGGGHVAAVKRAYGYVVLSESPKAAPQLAANWRAEDGSVVARTSGGVGANGRRSESLYVRASA